MTSLTDWQSKTTAFTWTANGQLATQADANGVTQTNTYDASGQTTAIVDASTAATLGTFGYNYDDAGLLVTDLGTFGLTSTGHDYGYDPLSQVTTVATSIDAGTPTSAAYDATSAGLLTANTTGATLAYNSAQQLSSVTPATGPATSFAYDGRGSRTSSTVAADGLTPAQTTSYAYTASGALASVGTPTTTVGYTSNAQGLRQSRTVGSATKQFTWSSVGGLPLLLDDGDHSYIYGPSSTPIAQVDDSTNDVEYLHGDLLGSTRLITDDSAAIVGANTFDEYGTRTPHTGTADSAIGYTGNWTDPDTGLVYLRARDYDPATGQFLAVDPAVDATAQPYAYAGNDPLLNSDPTGLDPAVQWWNPTTWDESAWQTAGAIGAGIVASVAVGAAIGAAGICTAATFGLCGIAVLVVGGAVAGAVSSAVTYGLEPGEKSACGFAEAVGWGTLAGAITGPLGAGLGKLLTPVVKKVVSSIAAKFTSKSGSVIPTLTIDAGKMPSIAKNIQTALDEGHPDVLTRVTDPRQIALNRAAACKGFCGEGSPDEYPFASTVEGGPGARVAGVPIGEQRIQGGVISQFYQANKIGSGDPFRVQVGGKSK